MCSLLLRCCISVRSLNVALKHQGIWRGSNPDVTWAAGILRHSDSLSMVLVTKWHCQCHFKVCVLVSVRIVFPLQDSLDA